MSFSLSCFSFVDYFEAGVWSEGYISAVKPPFYRVISAFNPYSTSVPEAYLAPFRSRTKRSVATDFNFVTALKSLGCDHFTDRIKRFITWESEFFEQEFVQIFGGFLPIYVSICEEMVYVQIAGMEMSEILGLYFSYKDLVSEAALTATWAGFCTCEQTYVTFKQDSNLLYTSLLTLHLKAIAQACSPCILSSFSIVKNWIFNCKSRFMYDWKVVGEAAEQFFAFCVKSLRVEEAVSTLALLTRCQTNSNCHYSILEKASQISHFLSNSQQLYREKAVILHYLLTYEASDKINDILGCQLLDDDTSTELTYVYPTTTAKLIALTAKNVFLRNFLKLKLVNFPLISIEILESLPQKEQFEVCLALKGEKLVSQVKNKAIHRKLREYDRLVVLWVACHGGKWRVPRLLTMEIARII